MANHRFLRIEKIFLDRTIPFDPHTAISFSRRTTRLLGWGGAGKSTLARLITTLQPAPNALLILRGERMLLDRFRRWILLDDNSFAVHPTDDPASLFTAPGYSSQVKNSSDTELQLIREAGLPSWRWQTIEDALRSTQATGQIPMLPAGDYFMMHQICQMVVRRIFGLRMPVVIDGPTHMMDNSWRPAFMRYHMRHQYVTQLILFETPTSGDFPPPTHRLQHIDNSISVIKIPR